MIYTVAHRDKKGHLILGSFSASSREELFNILKEQGISAVRITEGEVKTKTSHDSKKKTIILFSFLALVLIGAFIILLRQQQLPEAPTIREQKKVHEVRRPLVKKISLTNNENKPKQFWMVDETQTNGFTAVQLKKWQKEHRVLPAYTNISSRSAKKSDYAIFNTHCENEIACYLTMTPGETLVGSPHYSKKQLSEYIKALDEPMIYNKEDTEFHRELRQAVEETKADLKKRLAAGEDIGEIFSSTREEFQDLARYKVTIQEMLSELKRNPATTIEDVDLFVEAANRKLEEKGVAPLKLGVITRRMLQQYHNKEKGGNLR